MTSTIKNFLIDIDGVLLHDESIIAGAREAIAYLEQNQFKFVLVTNTTRMAKRLLLHRLNQVGLKVKDNQVITPVSATIDYIRSHNENAKCFLVTPDELKDEFAAGGLWQTMGEAPVDYVVLGYDMRIDFNMLNMAFRFLKNGAELVAMHESKSFPARPQPYIGLGAFVRALEYSTNKKATIIGKPNKNFFNSAMKAISAAPESTAMIGDSYQGDIVGARNAGLTTIMVRTGNFDDKELGDASIQPDVIIDSIKDLPGLLQKDST